MSVGLLLIFAIQGGLGSGVDAGPSLHQLRTTDSIVSAVIQDGMRRSPTFAALVEVVERSAIFVYIVRTHTLPHHMDGCLVHEGRGAESRYLRVLLLMGTPSERLIVVLAHELQHVREVLDAGIAIDEAAMDALFRRIGIPQRGTDSGEQYETAAAQHVMTVVLRELRNSPRPRQQ